MTDATVGFVKPQRERKTVNEWGKVTSPLKSHLQDVDHEVFRLGMLRVAKFREQSINSLVFTKSQLEDSQNQEGISKKSEIHQPGFLEDQGLHFLYLFFPFK